MPDIFMGKFVVLGGASQVGSHIAEHLLSAGAEAVVLLDNLSLGSTETIEPLLADSRCTFVRADLLRLNELVDPLEGADGVFAVAGIMATNIRENPWMGLDVNVRGFQNALEACRLQKVKKVVISSSVGVYGVPQDVPTTESSPLNWQNLPPASILYSAGKIMAEGLAQIYRERYGIDFVALRYSAVYGERQHQRAVMGGHIAETCRRIRRGEAPIVEGEGIQVQDYVYVADVARANLLAMERSIAGVGINIVAGQDTSQARIVEIALQACASALKPTSKSMGPVPLPPTTHLGYSRQRAKEDLGWEPQVSIEEGIGRVLRWVDEQQTKSN
jgi:UDP-glucose 4-epimerase